jgi:hypothetical protein
MSEGSQYNRGTKYLFKNNYAKALQFFKRETLSFKELHLNTGNCYRGLGDLSRAVSCYLLANSPDGPMSDGSYIAEYTLALNNLGLASYMMGDDLTAISCYTRALAIDPLYMECLWNYANAYLRSGFSGADISWDKGWGMYGYRFKRPNGAVRVTAGVPIWDGYTPGTSIVVMAEQGLGDKIMFSRYIPFLAEYFSEIIIECTQDLEVFYGGYKCVRSALGAAPVGIPVCSLAKYFYNKHPTPLAVPYEPKKITTPLLSPKIGVVWSGSATHANNHNRSCLGTYMSDLGGLGTLYSLNPGERHIRGVVPMSSASWERTIALVAELDLVITVDTSIVHLCGSMGVPTIMIQPLCETDFRWGNAAGPNYWYPSVHVVNNSNWDVAFTEVRALASEKLGIAKLKHMEAFASELIKQNVQNN